MLSLRNTDISAKQKSYHDKIDEIVIETKIIKDKDKRILLIYLLYGFTIHQRPKVA